MNDGTRGDKAARLAPGVGRAAAAGGGASPCRGRKLGARASLRQPMAVFRGTCSIMTLLLDDD